jgi:small subunit ribosomal protein S6
MRYYETLFIVTPEIAEEEVTPVIEKFSGILTDHGAIMAKIDNWGRRRLAYEVKKFNKGYYVLFEYGSEPEGVAEMERNFKIDEQVIRFLTVKKGDEFDPETMIQEPEPEEPEPEEAPAEEPAAEEAAAEEAPAEEPAAEEAAAEEAPAEEAASEEAAAEQAPAEEAPAESAESTDEEPKE